MAILDLLTLDDVAEGKALTTADVGGTSSPWSVWTTTTSMQARASAAAHGARGARIYTADSPAVISYDEGSPTSATRVWSFYFTLNSPPSAASYFTLINDGTNAIASARFNADFSVTIRDGTTATGGNSTNLIQIGQTYRVEWMLRSVDQEMRIFEGESTSPYITLEGTLSNSSKQVFNCGASANPSGQTISIDTFRIADDWTGPYGTPEVPLNTPSNFTFQASETPGVVSIASTWSSVSGAGFYEIELERERDGLWQAFTTISVTGTSRTLTTSDGLVAGGTYRARIRALPPGWES